MIKDWPSAAACRTGDPNALFVQGPAATAAKAVCRGCPVRYECLADALDNRIDFGIWGGMTERERRGLLRRHPKVISWWRLLEPVVGAHRPQQTQAAHRDFAELRESLTTEEYAACYDAEFALLVRFVIRHGICQRDAFDAAQEAFVSAFRFWAHIHHPRAWLRTVAIRSLRQPLDRPWSPGWLAGVAPQGTQATEPAEQTRDVLRALRQLPAQQRQVIAWSLDGFAPAEIADELGITIETVRQALVRGRANLKRMLRTEPGYAR